MKKYDLIVLGGGFSGVAAALSAAREGARVLLVEKGNCLGGAAVNCLVNPFMPWYTKINGVPTSLSAGLFRTIFHRLEERNAVHHAAFSEEELKFLLNEMAEEAGVSLLYHAYLTDAEVEDGRICAVSVATKSGICRLEADYFIDATGDAQLAFLAHLPTVLGRESDHLCQPMTLCFRLGNVDVDRFVASQSHFQAAYREARKTGEIQNPREDILVFETLAPNVLHFNTTRVVKMDPTSPTEVTQAEILAR